MKKPKKNNKVEEPFPPENTPAPPQVMNPNAPNERDEKSAPKENPTGSQANRNNPSGENKEPKKKLLGESEIEIDDETTI